MMAWFKKSKARERPNSVEVMAEQIRELQERNVDLYRLSKRFYYKAEEHKKHLRKLNEKVYRQKKKLRELNEINKRLQLEFNNQKKE